MSLKGIKKDRKKNVWTKVLCCALTGREGQKLVMEYLPLGSLSKYLPEHKHELDTRQLLVFAQQICEVCFGFFCCFFAGGVKIY